MTFTHHSRVLTVPRLVTAEPGAVQQFSGPLGRDLFAFGAELMAPHVPQLAKAIAEAQAKERQHNLDAMAEELTEGRTWPRRTDMHND